MKRLVQVIAVAAPLVMLLGAPALADMKTRLLATSD